MPRHLRDLDDEVEGPVDGSDEDGEEGALLTLGLLEGDEEGCLETLDDSDGEVRWRGRSLGRWLRLGT